MSQRPGARIDQVLSRLAQSMTVLVFSLLASVASAGAQTPMTVLAPVGGEKLVAGSENLVRWSPHAGAATYSLLYSTNGGKKWTLAAQSLTDTEYLWLVPSVRGGAKKSLLQVLALDLQGKKLASARTAGPFTIEVVQITSPNSPLMLTSGEMLDITWETGATVAPVAESRLYFSTSGGEKWGQIATLAGNPGSHDWSVPDVPKERSKCLVRIILADASGSKLAIDESDARFTVKPHVAGAPELILSNQIIPPIWQLSADAGSVYLGGQFEIIQVDKVSRSRRTLAGNVGDVPSMHGFEAIDFPYGFSADTDHVYFTNSGKGQIDRLFLGNDGLDAPATIVAQPGLGFSFKHFAVNETHAFWAEAPHLPASTIRTKLLGSDALPEPLVTVSNLSGLAATASNLFLAGHEDPNDTTGDVSIYRFDLGGGGLQLIQSDIELDPGRDVPIAVTSTQVFWVNGDAIDSAEGPGWTAQPLVSGIPDITALTVEGGTLFALEGVLSHPATIHEVPLATGIADPLITLDDIRNILAYGGNLYWISGLGLYTLDSMDHVQELYVNNGSDIVFGGAGGSYLLGVGGTLLAGDHVAEERVLAHDILADTSTLVDLMGSSRWMAVNTASAYYGSYNSGIVRLPPALNFREPETLFDTPVTPFDRPILDGGWVYWTSAGGTIERMHEDGSMPQTLHPSFTMGLALHDGRLYFLCEIACSQPSWSLMSMALSGGSPTLEVALGLDAPYLVRKTGDVLLVANEESGGTSVHAVNLSLKTSAPLFGPTTSAYDIAATPGWLYLNFDGCLTRFKRTGWDSVDPKHPESVDTCSVNDLGVNTMQADGPELYYHYWEQGLKRVSD